MVDVVLPSACLSVRKCRFSARFFILILNLFEFTRGPALLLVLRVSIQTLALDVCDENSEAHGSPRCSTIDGMREI